MSVNPGCPCPDEGPRPRPIPDLRPAHDDRNPQTFVPSVFWARPEDYRKATQRVFHAPGRTSFVELPLITPN